MANAQSEIKKTIAPETSARQERLQQLVNDTVQFTMDRFADQKLATNQLAVTLVDLRTPQAPVQASYRVTQALLGVKLAVEKAMAANSGKKPTSEQMADALRGSNWDSPGGPVRMALGNGQQAIQDTAIGRTKYDAASKRVLATDIQRFKAECVNPPANTKSIDWIKSGFPGAKCE